MRSSSEANPPRDHVVRFGNFELRHAERTLTCDGASMALGARAFDLLAALVEHAGSLVMKADLIDRVWPGLVVEENNLQVQISHLRKALGPNAVTTIPGRGYRFELAITSDSPGRSTSTVEASAEPSASRARPRSNLPGRSESLYGRAGDVAAIHALLGANAVVTVVGAGGIGKTRLAQAVAGELAHSDANPYPDGVWWVELAALNEGTLLASTVAKALGLQLPGGTGDQEALTALLAEQRLLVVLDNCEHLADAIAAHIDDIVANAPGVQILATSQETLKARGEHVYRLGALRVPSDDAIDTASSHGAVELFLARARAGDPRFTLTVANAAAIVEICRRLDGIPLAIELAVARLPLLGVEGLRTRLHQRFKVLTGGARVVLRRHQTLRATLEWSHGLLTADEQTVFRRLGVFAGGFTLEAAQYVASDERIDHWTALEHLGALVDKSLVLAEGDPIPRYRMLETTRAYALERLADTAETELTLRRHAEALLAQLARLDAVQAYSFADRAALAAISVEIDNVRAALTWADTDAGHDLALPLATASYRVWWATVRLAEGFERCLALHRHLDSSVSKADAAKYWHTLAKLGMYGMRREALDAASRAIVLLRELGDDINLCNALVYAAIIGSRFSPVEEMVAAIDEASSLMRQDWPPRQRASLCFARYRCLSLQGRSEEALQAAQEQAAISRETGDDVGAQFPVSNIVGAEMDLGRMEDALAHAQAAIARLHEHGADAGAGHLYFGATVALIELERFDEALDAGRAAYYRLLQEDDECRLLLPLSLLAAGRGRYADAARILGFEHAIRSGLGTVMRAHARRLEAQLDRLLARELSAVEIERLRAEGAAMRKPEVFTLALDNGA